MPKIDLEWQPFEGFTADRLYELLGFRQSIFVVEQRSPYPDLDGLDAARGIWQLGPRVSWPAAFGFCRLQAHRPSLELAVSLWRRLCAGEVWAER